MALGKSNLSDFFAFYVMIFDSGKFSRLVNARFFKESFAKVNCLKMSKIKSWPFIV